MAAETIREFLVKLGYSNDEAGLKKFTDSVNSANRTVTNFIHALEAVVTGALATRVIRGFTHFAESLEDLYFASRRTGASAYSLKLLDRAAQDLGAHAGEAVSSVEAFAQLLREQPGKVTFLESIVGNLTRTKDGSIDALANYTRLVAALKKQYSNPDERWVALRQGAMLGIDSGLMQQFMSGDLPGAMSRAGRAMGGVNWDKATTGAHEFENTMRDLGTVLETFGMQVWQSLHDKFGFSLEAVSRWLQAHRQGIVDDIDKIFTVISKGVTWVEANGPKVVKWFEDLDKRTHGWSTTLAGLAVVLGASGTGSIVGGVASLAGGLASLSAALIRLGIAASPVLITVGGIAAALTAIYAVTQAIQGKDASNWISDLVAGPVGKGMDWLGNLLSHTGPRGVRNNNPGNLKFAGQPGATGADDKGFAIFGNPYEGMLAMAKQLELYGGRGLNTISSIVNRWTAGDPDADRIGYIQDVMRRMQMSANASMNLRDPAVLTNLMNAMAWHENNGPVPFGGMMGGAAQAAIINYNNNSQNTVHAHGGDSREVADRVHSKLKTLSSETMRNTNGAAQ